jgi:hypothetical protein
VATIKKKFTLKGVQTNRKHVRSDLETVEYDNFSPQSESNLDTIARNPSLHHCAIPGLLDESNVSQICFFIKYSQTRTELCIY